jgi:hypothetical protein
LDWTGTKDCGCGAASGLALGSGIFRASGTARGGGIRVASGLGALGSAFGASTGFGGGGFGGGAPPWGAEKLKKVDASESTKTSHPGQKQNPIF